MILGERVRDRMVAAGLSQAELARRVGLAQPTIFNLIHRSKKGSTHIHRIARELGTTPAYLAGETDNPEGQVPSEAPLSAEARQLLECFGELVPADRAAVLRHALSLAGKLAPPGSRLNTPQTGFRG